MLLRTSGKLLDYDDPLGKFRRAPLASFWTSRICSRRTSDDCPNFRRALELPTWSLSWLRRNSYCMSYFHRSQSYTLISTYRLDNKWQLTSSSKSEIQQSPPFWWWQSIDNGVNLNSPLSICHTWDKSFLNLKPYKFKRHIPIMVPIMMYLFEDDVKAWHTSSSLYDCDCNYSSCILNIII